MRSYDDAFYTIEDIRNAEIKSRGIIGHDNMAQLLETMTNMKWDQIPWFRLADSDRDIISDYCGVKPRWENNK